VGISTGLYAKRYWEALSGMVDPERLKRAEEYTFENGCDIFDALDDIRQEEPRHRYGRRQPKRPALPPRRPGEVRNTRRYVRRAFRLTKSPAVTCAILSGPRSRDRGGHRLWTTRPRPPPKAPPLRRTLVNLRYKVGSATRQLLPLGGPLHGNPRNQFSA
jgi:hypothetical protein